MTSTVTKRTDGLKEIIVPCMRCEADIPVVVAADYNRKMRKFCSVCKKALGSDSIFEGSLTDGCRRVVAR